MAKLSPLTYLHKKNGARFREDQGWTLPLHWGNVRDEYNTIRSHVGVLDLCNRSLLSFTGEDRVSFLQGMVSNDVTTLSPGHGIAAVIADVQGKILGDINILCTEEAFILYLTDFLKNQILDHLNHYLIADDVKITDITSKHGILSLQGLQSKNMLQALLEDGDLPSDELSHEQVSLDSVQVRIIRTSHTEAPGFDLWVPAHHLATVAESLQKKGQPFSAQWVGTEAQEILRIELGIPRYGIDMNEQNLVLETGLEEHAVSFNKGCYLGQAVIERIHSRGHVNKKFTGLILEGKEAPHSGDKRKADNKEIGKVTSSTLSPRLDRPVALAYVHRDYLVPGTVLNVQSGNQAIPAVVSSLPFNS